MLLVEFDVDEAINAEHEALAAAVHAPANISV